MMYTFLKLFFNKEIVREDSEEKALATTKIFGPLLLLREPSPTNPFSDLYTVHLRAFDFILPQVCQMPTVAVFLHGL